MAIPRNYLAPLVAALLCALPAQLPAQDTPLPQRDGVRPQTTDGVPHVQLGIEADPDLSEALLQRVADMNGVRLGPTRISLPGAIGFHLEDGVHVAQPQAIVGGREFAHLHPDGSLHAALDPATARAAVAAGWAVPHPWADQRPGWEGFVMIYTPTNARELETVHRLIAESYAYVTGS